jgi:hypothetical protein
VEKRRGFGEALWRNCGENAEEAERAMKNTK